MANTQIELAVSSTQKEVSVHVLPCHIAHDGLSNVDAHFKPRVDVDDVRLSTAPFRGRRLRGRTVALPDHYSGNCRFGVVD